jgi:hypothetical protein
MSEDKITIDCDFPGGNIVLDAIEWDTIHLHQDLRDTEIDWFYWYFRLRGAAGRNVKIHFTGSDAIGVRGPAVSLDRGQRWRWLGLEYVEGQTFSYLVPLNSQEVRFSFGMPYVQVNFEDFMRKYPRHPGLRQDVLCKSRKGRPVELLYAGHMGGKADYHVLLTCRHHCCEMMASYSLEGMIDKVMEDSDTGRWLREHVAFLVVAFMDKDGVEDGDQGKRRRPHDHNRDYGSESIYPEVRALRELTSRWSDNKLDFFLDLHCPWMRGDYHEFIYFVGDRGQVLWPKVEAFSAILEATRKGPLPYLRKNNLPFGKDWNTGDETGRSSSEWASELFGIRFTSGIEIPYANASGVPVTAESARAFGVDLGSALALFLQSS